MGTRPGRCVARGVVTWVGAALILLAPGVAAHGAPRDGTPGAEAAPAGGGRAGPAARRGAVLFIADGMGPAYVTAARLARGGSAGRLRMDGMPHTALVRTYSSDSPVTDSAAAASAMACGRKTAIGVLCQDETAVSGRRDGRRLESIALRAKARGLRVGIISTARVTHATPAAFYAVNNDRDREREIARDAVASPLDFLLGGGRRYFRAEQGASGAGSGTAGASGEESGTAGEGGDLEAAARARGFRIVDSAAALRAVASLESRILGLFADGHLPYEAERDGRTAPTLVEMTRWAIERLRAAGGPFLLVVEGGRIDHAGHDNWARTMVDEILAFDEAVGLALDRLDPGTTLVLVTADHETGGLAINGYPPEGDGIWGATEPWGGGEPYPVLTFATGPGTGRPSPEAPHGRDDPRPAGVPLADAAHTGVDVALYAWGAGADQVRGTLENTAIYWLLREHIEGKRAPRERLIEAPRQGHRP